MALFDGSTTIEYGAYVASSSSASTPSADSKKAEEKNPSSVFTGEEAPVTVGDGFERKRKISPEEALDDYIEGYSKMEPIKKKAELKAFLLKIAQQGPEAVAKFNINFKAKTGIDILMDKSDCDKHLANPTIGLLKNDIYKEMLETQLLKSDDKKAAFKALKTDEEKAKFIENEFKATLTPEGLAKYEKSPNATKTQMITNNTFKNSEIFEKMDGVAKNKYLSANENEKKLIRGEEFFKTTLNEKQLKKYNELTTAEEKEEFILNGAFEDDSFGGKIAKLFGKRKEFSDLSEEKQIEKISKVLAKCETPEEMEFMLQTRFRGFKLSEGNSNLLTKAIADQKTAQNLMTGFEHMFEDPDATDHIKENAITTVYDHKNVKKVMGEDGQAHITEVAINNGSIDVKQFTTNTMAEKGSFNVIKHVTDSVNGGDDLEAKECLANSAHLAKGESERYMFKSSYDTNIESVQKNLAKNTDLYDDENRGDFVNKLKNSQYDSIKNDTADYIKEHPEYANYTSDKTTSISAAAVVSANTTENNSAPLKSAANSSEANNSKSIDSLKQAFIDEPTITGKIQLAAEMNRPDLIEKIVERLSDSQKSKLLDKMSSLPNGVKKDILAVIDRTNPSLEMVQKMKKIKIELGNQDLIKASQLNAQRAN